MSSFINLSNPPPFSHLLQSLSSKPSLPSILPPSSSFSFLNPLSIGFPHSSSQFPSSNLKTSPTHKKAFSVTLKSHFNLKTKTTPNLLTPSSSVHKFNIPLSSPSSFIKGHVTLGSKSTILQELLDQSWFSRIQLLLEDRRGEDLIQEVGSRGRRIGEVYYECLKEVKEEQKRDLFVFLFIEMLELITLLSSYIQLQKPPPKKSSPKIQKPPSFADFLNGIDYLIEMIEASREEEKEGMRRRDEERGRKERERGKLKEEGVRKQEGVRMEEEEGKREIGGRREMLQVGFVDIKTRLRADIEGFKLSQYLEKIEMTWEKLESHQKELQTGIENMRNEKDSIDKMLANNFVFSKSDINEKLIRLSTVSTLSNSHSQIDALSSLESFYKNRLTELETKNINLQTELTHLSSLLPTSSSFLPPPSSYPPSSFHHPPPSSRPLPSSHPTPPSLHPSSSFPPPPSSHQKRRLPPSLLEKATQVDFLLDFSNINNKTGLEAILGGSREEGSRREDGGGKREEGVGKREEGGGAWIGGLFRLPDKTISSLMGLIVADKIVEDREKSLGEYVGGWFLARFGNQSFAVGMLRDFLGSIKEYAGNNERCRMFARLCGLEGVGRRREGGGRKEEGGGRREEGGGVREEGGGKEEGKREEVGGREEGKREEGKREEGGGKVDGGEEDGRKNGMEKWKQGYWASVEGWKIFAKCCVYFKQIKAQNQDVSAFPDLPNTLSTEDNKLAIEIASGLIKRIFEEEGLEERIVFDLINNFLVSAANEKVPKTMRKSALILIQKKNIKKDALVVGKNGGGIIEFENIVWFIMESLARIWGFKMESIAISLKLSQGNRKINDFFLDDFSNVILKQFPKKTSKWINSTFSDFIFFNKNHTISPINNLLQTIMTSFLSEAPPPLEDIEEGEVSKRRGGKITKKATFHEEKAGECFYSLILFNEIYALVRDLIRKEEINNDTLFMNHEVLKKEVSKLPYLDFNKGKGFAGGERREVAGRVESCWKSLRVIIDCIYSRGQKM